MNIFNNLKNRDIGTRFITHVSCMCMYLKNDFVTERLATPMEAEYETLRSDHSYCLKIILFDAMSCYCYCQPEASLRSGGVGTQEFGRNYNLKQAQESIWNSVHSTRVVLEHVFEKENAKNVFVIGRFTPSIPLPHHAA